MRLFWSNIGKGAVRYMDLPGEAAPIVFIHGLGCAASHDYVEVASQPVLAKHRRLLVDLFGFGYSDSPQDFFYSVEGHAQVLCEFLKHLALRELIVFGHSMGGSIAIELCSFLGSKVKQLIITEGNLDPGGGPGSRSIAAFSQADYVKSAHRAMVGQALREKNYFWAATAGISSPRAVHQGACSLVEGSSPSWREKLYAFKFPRTYIIGTKSLPDKEVEELPKHGVSVVLFSGVGHNMANEDPEGLAEILGKTMSIVG